MIQTILKDRGTLWGKIKSGETELNSRFMSDMNLD